MAAIAMEQRPGDNYRAKCSRRDRLRRTAFFAARPAIALEYPPSSLLRGPGMDHFTPADSALPAALRYSLGIA